MKKTKVLVTVDLISDDLEKYETDYLIEEPEMAKTQMIEDVQRALRFDYDNLHVKDLRYYVVGYGEDIDD